MNNVNKVKAKIRKTIFELLKDQSLEEISINDLCDKAQISRASFYRNYNSIYDIIMDYYQITFESVLNEINDSPYKTRAILTEILEIILAKRNEFTLLLKRHFIGLLNTFFKQNLDFKYYGNNFKTDSFVGCTIALIASWIGDNYKASIDDVISMLQKIIFFADTLLHMPKTSEIVVSTKTMRDSDKATIDSGVSSKNLMYRAGEAIYKSHKWKGKIAIVCGKGNNAGDGFVLAFLLFKAKKDVELLLISDDFSPDGQFYFNICKGKGIKYKKINRSYSFDNYDVIVDAIFGTGFKGMVKSPYREIIENINNSNKHVISIDINSGLNGDSGMCDIAIKSDLTLSIGSYKSGLFLNMAKDYIKVVKNADIGIKLLKEDYLILGSDDVNKCIKKRSNFSNKGSYGYICILGGSSLYSGAVRLAELASSSMKQGSGVTMIAAPKSLGPLITPLILESTFYPLSEEDGSIKLNTKEIDLIMNRCKTIAFGMGLTTSIGVKDTLIYLLNNYKGNLIIDADGLNVLSQIDNSYLINSNAKIVLTPHLKEFSRLTKLSIDEINDNPIVAAKEYAKEHRCIVLLKGPTTIVTDGKKVLLSNRGTPGMATAGSGDVLSGILASIVSYNDNQLLLAVASGAYINGLAGEIAQNFSNDISMTSKDTINNISRAINLIHNN